MAVHAVVAGRAVPHRSGGAPGAGWWAGAQRHLRRGASQVREGAGGVQREVTALGDADQLRRPRAARLPRQVRAGLSPDGAVEQHQRVVGGVDEERVRAAHGGGVAQAGG